MRTIQSLLSLGLASLVAISAPAVAKQAEKAAIGGYCPVAYSVAGKALKGDPKFTSKHDGKLYRFVRGDAKKLYDAAPDKYRVGYDGFCATGVALGKKLAADPQLFTVYNGVTYLFSSKEAKEAFDKDLKGMAEKADANWGQVQKQPLS